MPIVGFRCPDGIKVNGTDEHDFNFCINSCPKPCFPPILMRVIKDSLDKDEHKGDMISVTALKGCFRQLWFERKRDLFLNPAELWFAARGHIIHKILEVGILGQPDKDRFLTETRFFLDDLNISGQLDLIDKQDRILYDFKTIGDRGLNMIPRYGAKEDHIWQINCYRYLWKYGRAEGIENNRFNIDKIKIIYITLMSALETGSMFFNKTARKKTEYLEIKDVPIFSDKKIKKYIDENLELLRNILSEDKEPDFIPSEQDQTWLCGTKYGGRGYCKATKLCSYWKELFPKGVV